MAYARLEASSPHTQEGMCHRAWISAFEIQPHRPKTQWLEPNKIEIHPLARATSTTVPAETRPV